MLAPRSERATPPRTPARCGCAHRSRRTGGRRRCRRSNPLRRGPITWGRAAVCPAPVNSPSAGRSPRSHAARKSDHNTAGRAGQHCGASHVINRLLRERACQGTLLPDGNGAILQPENEIEPRWLTSQCAKLGSALGSVTVAVHANLHECITHRDLSAGEER